MNGIVIRPATLADLPEVRQICLLTCTDPDLLKQPKTLYWLYADYYLHEEMGHCFVATLPRPRHRLHPLVFLSAEALPKQ
jgi:hypothetical protein